MSLILQDCCSALEAQGAGAPHAETKAEKESQIDRDVPRTSYKVLGEKYGCAMGENVEANIREKQVREGEGGEGGREGGRGGREGGREGGRGGGGLGGRGDRVKGRY